MIFATFFDINYLSRGIVLINSLQNNCVFFEFYILCLDEQTRIFFKERPNEFPQVKVITTHQIENEYPELAIAKSNRSLIEYYFTLSPFLPKYILNTFQTDHVCTLDADIKFYSSPKLYFNQLDKYSIVITPHKFSKENLESLPYGIYNVSFQIFKNDKIAHLCLNNWAKQCLNWCSDKLDTENNRFADQLYLNNWDIEYENSVYVIDDCVGGIAPWNLNNYKLSQKNGDFLSMSKEIIFFHFHHFRVLDNFVINGFNQYSVNKNKITKLLYYDYWKSISLVEKSYNLESYKGIRYVDNKKIVIRLIESGSFYFFNSIMRIGIDLSKSPKIFRKLIYKIYA